MPQGYILGPLLFILHFNDAQQNLLQCKIIITYADDTIIYFHHKNISVIEKVLNAEFSYLSDWLKDNELILNLKKDKTEIMIFGTQKRLSKADRNLNIEYQSIQVNNKQSYKYLGIKVDPSLNFNEHFESIYKSASARP